MEYPKFIAFICVALALPSGFAQIVSTCPVSSSFASSNIKGEFKATFSVNFAAPFAYTAWTGRPYSAEEISQQKQTLPDGSSVTTGSPSVFYYRDSAGRVRTERPLNVFGAVKASEIGDDRKYHAFLFSGFTEPDRLSSRVAQAGPNIAAVL